MIKFTATTPNGPLVGLGLSHENLDRLKAGQPIAISLGDLITGSVIEVLIFAGPTEYEMTEQIARLIGPDTRLRRGGSG